MHEVKVGQKYQIVGDWANPLRDVVTVSHIVETEVHTNPSVYAYEGYDRKKLFFPDFSSYKESGEQRGYILAVDVEEPVEEDAVNHPSHYTSDPSGVECLQITRHRNFNIGNAIKYLWRAGLKEDASLDNQEKEIQDLEKAIFYIKDEIKRKREA